MFCMDKFFISSFQLEQIADGSECSIGIFIIALPNRLFSRFPGMGNIIATIWLWIISTILWLSSIRFRNRLSDLARYRWL